MHSKAIGLLGGTFNPVHFGHLRAAVECLEAFDLAELRLMPCRPVHKPQLDVSDASRLAMLALAIEGTPHLAIEPYEVGQAQATYTIDTLKYIRSAMGEQTPLYFILGADAFNAIETWKDWQHLLDLTNFIVLDRPASTLTITHPLWRSRLQSFTGKHYMAGNIYHLPMSALDISSTHIRQLIREQRSIDFLLPKPVITYIQQQRLYQ